MVPSTTGITLQRLVGIADNGVAHRAFVGIHHIFLISVFIFVAQFGS
jgi:hypothetical protein